MTLGDIQKKVYALTATNVNSYPNANMLIDINNAYNRVTSLILQSAGRWQWDDDNQPTTDQGAGVGGQSNGTTPIVANQQDYSFPVSYLDITRLEIKLSNGTYFYKLIPRDVEDPMWGGYSKAGVDTVTTGAPVYYDIVGHSVFLYPIPNYSQAASLRFYFNRGQIDFTLSDLTTGTVSPGFASPFHDLIAYLVAFDYAAMNEMPRATSFFNAIARKEAALTQFYATRNMDDRPRMTMAPVRFR